MQNKQISTKSALKLSGLLLLLVFTACTKEIPYEHQYKEDITSKTLVDENAEYLLVSSTGATSRTSEDRPFWMGETRIVKLKFAEDALQVIETEQDQRFQDNTTNNKVVLEIPVTHHKYRCAKDRNGECTNKEEDASDLHWSQKSSFKPNFASSRLKAADSSTVEFDKLFGDGCYSEIGSKTLSASIEKEAINIQLEKTYRINLYCISDIDSWEELFTKTIANSVVHYSIVKLDTLASKDYVARKYTQEESGTFGYFDQTTKTLDVDLRPTVQTEGLLISRWNPNRKVIDFHLSDEFAKPQNKAITEATFKAIERINRGLKEAGAKFEINLHNPSGKQPGDIRNSMIVMVEDPIEAGLLGYGPSVKNPRTGEIVSARTVMYPGVMKQIVMMTYNEIYHQRKAELQAVTKSGLDQISVSPALLKLPLTLSKQSNDEEASDVVDEQELLAKKVRRETIISPRFESRDSIVSVGEKLKELQKQMQKTKNVVRISSATVKQLKDIETVEESVEDRVKRELFYSRNCFYPAETMALESGLAQAVSAKLGDVTKPWHELSESEKQAVMDIIMPEAWTQTLIHELGHNLGLRHNFNGSEDAANFYTAEELAQMGVNHKIPYSSVMEYGASSLNELPTLGKYDIAALRFAYANKVAVVDEQGQESIVDLGDSNIDQLKAELASQKLALKDYRFCTDEHADANAGCNRFDEGTNNVEMVQFMINEYKKRQFYLQRLDRRNFSVANDHLYASGTAYRFFHIRAFFEGYERLKVLLEGYNLDIEDPNVWAQYPFIKDVRDAAHLAGEFFLNVLQTPDTTCAVSLAANPNQIIAVLPLSSLDGEQLSCYDVQLNPAYKVVAEAGRSFNSKKSPTSENPYADQIDLRGIWSDKVLATKFLLARKMNHSTYDKNVDNFTDISTLTQGIFDVLAALSVDNLVVNGEFETKNGQKLNIPLAVELKSNLINAPLYWWIARIIGVPNRESYLQETVLDLLVKNMMNSPLKISTSNAEYMDAFKVTRMSSAVDEDMLKFDTKYVNLGADRFIAAKENVLAQELITNVVDQRVLKGLGEKLVTQVLTLKLANKPIKDLDLQEVEATKRDEVKREARKAYEMSPEYLQAFLKGQLQPEETSITLLKLLPQQ